MEQDFLTNGWIARVVGFLSLDTFQQSLRCHGWAAWEASGTLRSIPILVNSIPNGDHATPRWEWRWLSGVGGRTDCGSVEGHLGLEASWGTGVEAWSVVWGGVRDLSSFALLMHMVCRCMGWGERRDSGGAEDNCYGDQEKALHGSHGYLWW